VTVYTNICKSISLPLVKIKNTIDFVFTIYKNTGKNTSKTEGTMKKKEHMKC